MRVDKALLFTALMVALAGAGCGGDEATPPARGPQAPVFAGSGALPPVASPTTGTPTTGALPPTGTAVGTAGSPAAPPVATPVAPTPTAPAGTSQVPCDVATAVSDGCTSCHGTTPSFGAPMALMTHADFMAPAKSNPAKKVYEVIPARINATVPAQMMPPPTSGSALTPAGLQSLNTWLTAGAKPVAMGCPITVKGAGTPTTGAPTTGTPGMGTTSMRSGGGGKTPQEYNDPEMKCYDFLAHAQGSATEPFSVGTQPDMYTNFTFMPKWQGMQYVRSFKVKTDNMKVIHHWLFYKTVGAGADLSVAPSIGAHPDGELQHGWAPGGDSLYLDPDVGMEMPSNVAYQLETHHNNTTGAPAPDRSGVEVCVTPKVPKNVASISWLGTDNINGKTASGVCAPNTNQMIRILGGTPHMHTKGNHMSVEITRKGGMKEMLHDQPFAFADQRSYDVSTMIMPGDSLKTTCTFSSPARFGEGTNDEMCYFFTLYYPKLSLTNGNPVGTLIHGPNSCLQ